MPKSFSWFFLSPEEETLLGNFGEGTGVVHTFTKDKSSLAYTLVIGS